MSEKNSFIFYRSFFEASKPLNPEDRLALFDAIAEYALNQNETELTPMSKAMFCLIRPQLEANNTRYENGKNGGRPKKENNQKITEQKPKDNHVETETKANANLNVNVNANDKEESNIDFENLWGLYGHKKDKAESLKVFKACKSFLPEIIKSIESYKNYLKVTNYSQCSLAVFLRNKRWENDYKQLTEQHNETNRTSFKQYNNTNSGRGSATDAINAVDEAIRRGEI